MEIAHWQHSGTVASHQERPEFNSTIRPEPFRRLQKNFLLMRVWCVIILFSVTCPGLLLLRLLFMLAQDLEWVICCSGGRWLKCLVHPVCNAKSALSVR